MKNNIQKHISQGRASFLDALKFVTELDNKDQVKVIETINIALAKIDEISFILEKIDASKSSSSVKEILETMESKNDSDYKLMVLRLEPQVLKGTKIGGYLKTFHLPTCIPDIIEEIGKDYGGGKFQIRVVDSTGKYIHSKTFEISGTPKLPEKNDDRHL